MPDRLKDKTAIVIGAARGIGAGIAERFREEGARIVIADTETVAGEATAKRLGGRFVTTDISRKADAERAVATALEAFGDLHIVVQNAGIYPWQLIENTEPEQWDA
ncbi:MAG TPA: SDR family NAD(P)-dependent oxidoreductase, partial [Candidatus Acidoferrum sp.]|nr:SDR family NAD(P)-dependent oxidoreductase [Candidatus Acidoferrum sp.]